MEAIMEKRRNSGRAPAMAVHRASHAISKPKPKIRIIHIFAPEIIKTDVANFRELVQRLTGKPANEKIPAEIPAPGSDRKPEIAGVAAGFRGGLRRVKKEDEEEEEEEEEGEVLNDVVGMWSGGSAGGYFGDFADFEGFIEELGEFPLLPPAHQIMHGFEETQFA